MGAQQVATGSANFVVQRSAYNLPAKAKRRIRLLENILVGSGIRASDVRWRSLRPKRRRRCRRCARLGGSLLVLTQGRNFPFSTGHRECPADKLAAILNCYRFSATSIEKPLAFAEFGCTRLTRCLREHHRRFECRTPSGLVWPRSGFKMQLLDDMRLTLGNGVWKMQAGRLIVWSSATVHAPLQNSSRAELQPSSNLRRGSF